MAKKTFKDSIGNPAELFISTQTDAEAEHEAERTEGKLNIAPPKPKEETKSKRLQLLIKPSTLEQIKRTAKAQNSTTNDLINRILEAYINQ